MIPMPVIATFLTPIVAVVAGQVIAQATEVGGNGTFGLISSGGAVAVLGGVLTWVLTKTVPQQQDTFQKTILQQQETFRQTVKEMREDNQRESAAMRDQFAKEAFAQRETFAREMSAQREAQDKYNDRLIRWLSSRADLPAYPGESVPQRP